MQIETENSDAEYKTLEVLRISGDGTLEWILQT